MNPAGAIHLPTDAVVKQNFSCVFMEERVLEGESAQGP